MNGLKQTILMEPNAVKGLRDMVVGVSEKVDSSLCTALTSRLNTSRPVSGNVSILSGNVMWFAKGLNGRKNKFYS